MRLLEIDDIQFYHIDRSESFSPAIALLYNQLQSQRWQPITAIDTETNGADPRVHQVRLLQIAVPNCPAVLFDFGGFTLTAEQKYLLNGFLGNDKLLKVFQGGKFDIKMLAAMGVALRPPFFDTMLVSQIVRGSRRGDKHGLEDIVLRCLGINLDKSMQTSFIGMAIDEPLTPEQLKYGAIDVMVLTKLLPVLREQLNTYTSKRSTWNREQQMLPVLAAFETGGVHVDEAELRQLRYDLTIEQDKADEALQPMLNYGEVDLLGDQITIDLSSSRELKQAVESLGLGVTSLEDKDLLDKAHHQEIAAVLEYLKWAQQIKAIDDTLSKIEPPVVGMSRVSNLYPRYTQLEHGTGRLSSSRTGIEGWGIEYGRLSKAGWKVLKPRYQETALVGISLDEAPIRMLARVSQDQMMLDIYESTYSAIDWLVDKIGCEEAEAWVLWIGAGICNYGVKKLQMFAYQDCGMVLSKNVAKVLLERFWAVLPQLRQWHNDYQSNGVTLTNRYLMPQQTSRTDQVRHQVFGALSDLMKQAAIEVGRLLYSMNGKPYLIVGDTLIWEVPIDQFESGWMAAEGTAKDVYRQVLGAELAIGLIH